MTAEIRAKLGLPGPAYFVAPSTPPSFEIWVAGQLLQLVPSHPVNDRIDLVCLAPHDGLLHPRVVTGTPSGAPCPPLAPEGWFTVARVRTRAASTAVLRNDITEVRP